MYFRYFTFIVFFIFIIMILFHYSDLQTNMYEFMTTNDDQFNLLQKVAKNSGSIDNLNDSLKALTSKINSIQSSQQLYDDKIKELTNTQTTLNNDVQKALLLTQQNKNRILQAVGTAKTNSTDLTNQSDQISFNS